MHEISKLKELITLFFEQLNVNNNKKVLGLKDFSIELRKGEILGIAGVEGNGQTELVEALTGLRKVESGKITFKGQDITNLKIRDRINAGIAHIPEDRHKRGLVLEYSIEDNLILEKYMKEPYSNKFGILNRKVIREEAERIIKDFDVRSGEGAISRSSKLSGGNQQKAIIGREIELNPDLLIFFWLCQVGS